MIIAPSLLSANFADLKHQIAAVESSKATWLHYDVMDGHFVKNLTFGPAILKSIREITPLYLDVHLMITDPLAYVDVFAKAGANNITFHADALNDSQAILECIRAVKAHQIDVGITLKPSSDFSLIEPVLGLVDLVLVMSVEPGFGGQAFIPAALDRIEQLNTLRKTNGFAYRIEVDGGINDQTSLACLERGADVLVAGSYVFNHASISESVESLWHE